ncbi:MAG: OmpA family protein [Myxococcaceae bacterium]
MRTSFAIVAVAALAVGCAKPDFGPLQAEANQLIQKYSGQMTEVGAKIDGLIARASALPPNTPGVSEVVAALGTTKGKLATAGKTIQVFPARLQGAIQEGKLEGVVSLIGSLKSDVGTTLTGAVAAATESATKIEGAEQAAAAAAAQFSKQLSTGFSLTGSPAGIESQLLGFIEDAGKPVDKTTWFNFDRLTFQTGAAELDMDKSKDQLTNIAEVLKAYPTVKLKVGGYTDNAGNPVANKKLSLARAKTVAAELGKMGVEAARLDPEGYGSEHPVCAANDTEECRAANRRIAVRVAAK